MNPADQPSSGPADENLAYEITKNHLVHFTSSDPRCRGVELPEGLLLRYTLSSALYFYLRTGIRDGKIWTRIFASDSPYDRQKAMIGDVMTPIFEPHADLTHLKKVEDRVLRLGRFRPRGDRLRGRLPQFPGRGCAHRVNCSPNRLRLAFGAKPQAAFIVRRRIMRLATIQTSDGPRAAVLHGMFYVDLHATDPRLPASVRRLLEMGPASLELAREAARRADAVKYEAGRVALPAADSRSAQDRLHRPELSRSRRRVRRAHPQRPRTVQQVRHRPDRPRRSHRAAVREQRGRLRGRIGRRHRRGGPAPVGRAGARATSPATRWAMTFPHATGSSRRTASSGWSARPSTPLRPCGPALVTADEVPDPHNLGIRLRLNGQTMQDSNTKQMIFSVGEVVAICRRSSPWSPAT